jgi:hypothetical protein
VKRSNRIMLTLSLSRQRCSTARVKTQVDIVR